MKYKRLSIDELKELEKEFVGFLAAAQITAADWEKMKKHEQHKAEELIDVFSDMVYDKVMSKIEFLEFRDEKTLNIFYCKADKIELAGLKVKQSSSLDLTSPELFRQWNESNMNAVNVIRTERAYLKERGVEVFELLQSGCLITDNKLFDLISKML